VKDVFLSRTVAVALLQAAVMRCVRPYTISTQLFFHSDDTYLRRLTGVKSYLVVPLFERPRPLSHRPIVEINHPVWSGAANGFHDKGAPDVILVNRSEWTRNQTPQPSNIARRMDIACDHPRSENRQAFEAYSFHRLFFQPHDPRVANPARGASRCRRQRKLRDPSGVTNHGQNHRRRQFRAPSIPPRSTSCCLYRRQHRMPRGQDRLARPCSAQARPLRPETERQPYPEPPAAREDLRSEQSLCD
jgi:hypothetical protein